ncbi:NAD(+) diphosphatase [Micromonospora yangpuensis]|uniref:NAD(+) diphosphatase n=1 Tax=Micromonospora yangpuensis TaxID=683228 RepID=A0A1C6V8J4_9ACTN|nr:NADH pyrophosphatase [Micromonospora yangpuensis]SCL62673.1 NAD+ diphosphatase [Micromonospora yangpuensis]
MTTTGAGDSGPVGAAGDAAGPAGAGALSWEPPPLARTTLDRAAHRRTDKQWLAEAWPRSRVLVLDSAADGRALVSGDPPQLVLLTPDDLPPTANGQVSPLFLGVEPDGVAVFAVDAPLPDLAGTRPVNLRDVGHLLADRDAGILTTAVALTNWHLRHGYSSTTGRPTEPDEAGWSRVDPTGRRAWPRTDPAMIVLVHDGVPGPAGRCLLGNNAAWPRQDGRLRFSCLAGFVEAGESAEAAVLREVREEVGVTVDDIRYAGSQSWPFPGSLMLGFLARADATQPVRVDPTEITTARWFTRAEIAAVLVDRLVDAGDGRRVTLPMASSIAHFLIRGWLA